MRYVSIPVHENIECIISQAKNFNHYMPHAKIVLHLSTSANFSIEKLQDSISVASLQNCYVNPVQVETGWGGILNAHISNIKYIKTLPEADQIVFHSSNDMLVKDGVENYLDSNRNVFNSRLVMHGGRWWPGQEALKDKFFRSLVAPYGSGALFGSQIEGSAYAADLLYRMISDIEHSDLLRSNLFYPREELVFSTLANAYGVKPAALPYVYSEVHVFDRRLWSIFDANKIVLESKSGLSVVLKKFVNDFMFKMEFYKIKISDVKSISEGHSNFNELMNDGNYCWKIFDNKKLYGVKRIERDVSNGVRLYIEGMMQ
jgi:hypothetical protein